MVDSVNNLWAYRSSLLDNKQNNEITNSRNEVDLQTETLNGKTVDLIRTPYTDNFIKNNSVSKEKNKTGLFIGAGIAITAILASVVFHKQIGAGIKHMGESLGLITKNGKNIAETAEDILSRQYGFKNYDHMVQELSFSLKNKALSGSFDDFLAESLSCPVDDKIIIDIGNEVNLAVNDAISTGIINSQGLKQSHVDELNKIYSSLLHDPNGFSSNSRPKAFWDSLYFGKVFDSIEAKSYRISDVNPANSTYSAKISAGNNIKNIPDDVYAKILKEKVFFPKGIDNIAIKQQNTGDCYLLAALHSLSKNTGGQKILENMIEVLPDKSYRVTFANNKQVIVKADELCSQNGKLTAKTDYGIKIIERAYARLRRQNGYTYNGLNHKSMIVTQAGHTENALYDITGMERIQITSEGKICKGNSLNKQVKLESFAKSWQNDPHKDVNKKNVEDILTKLSNEPDKFVITASTPPDGPYSLMSNYPTMDPNHKLPCRHGYSIPTKLIDSNNRTITIINPHDTTLPVKITWDEFFEYFRSLSGIEVI